MANINSTYARRHYETALDLFEQGHYDKALAQINKAISKAPNNPDLYSTKGVFLHKMHDIINAIEAYRTAIEVSPDHAFSHYNLGLIFMKQNKTLQAIQEWESVIRVKPDDIDAIFNIAVALSHLGKRKEAIPFYEKVLQLSPTHSQTHQNLGVIYRDEGNFARAKMHLNKLSEIDATYIEVVQSEILKCEEQEFLAKLERDKKKFQESFSSDAEGALSKALLAIISENYDQALSISEAILATNSEEEQAKVIKGQAMAGLGRSSDAIATFMEVVALNSKNTDALFHLGNIFLGLGELEKSLSYFEKVQVISPDYPLIAENISSIKSKLNSEDD